MFYVLQTINDALLRSDLLRCAIPRACVLNIYQLVSLVQDAPD
jgi:hypothetical protein